MLKMQEYSARQVCYNNLQFHSKILWLVLLFVWLAISVSYLKYDIAIIHDYTNGKRHIAYIKSLFLVPSIIVLLNKDPTNETEITTQK